MQINIMNVVRHFMDLFKSKAYECFAFKSPVYVHVNWHWVVERPNSMVMENDIGLKRVNLSQDIY